MPHLPQTALESPSSQQEPDVTVLSWAGGFFLLLVTMETTLKAAVWESAKTAEELAMSPSQLPCCCHRSTERQKLENQD